MECKCRDWRENIAELNAPMVLQQLRAGVSERQFKRISHCPWCGEPLSDSPAIDLPVQSDEDGAKIEAALERMEKKGML